MNQSATSFATISLIPSHQVAAAATVVSLVRSGESAEVGDRATSRHPVTMPAGGRVGHEPPDSVDAVVVRVYSTDLGLHLLILERFRRTHLHRGQWLRHAGKGEQVGHRKRPVHRAIAPRQIWRPSRIVQVRVGAILEQPEKDFGDDPTPHLT